MSSIVSFFQTSPAPPQAIAQSLWLIIAFPLAGALVCGVFGKALGRANTGLVACMMVFGSLAMSVLAFWSVNDLTTSFQGPHSPDVIHYALGYDYGTWFRAGTFQVR